MLGPVRVDLPIHEKKVRNRTGNNDEPIKENLPTEIAITTLVYDYIKELKRIAQKTVFKNKAYALQIQVYD